jgi:hypothetical protein
LTGPFQRGQNEANSSEFRWHRETNALSELAVGVNQRISSCLRLGGDKTLVRWVSDAKRHATHHARRICGGLRFADPPYVGSRKRERGSAPEPEARGLTRSGLPSRFGVNLARAVAADRDEIEPARRNADENEDRKDRRGCADSAVSVQPALVT